MALEIPADLPDSRQAHRWYGEMVRCITIDTSTFLSNKTGRPVLSRAHQRFVHGFYKVQLTIEPDVVFCGSFIVVTKK